MIKHCIECYKYDTVLLLTIEQEAIITTASPPPFSFPRHLSLPFEGWIMPGRKQEWVLGEVCFGLGKDIG